MDFLTSIKERAKKNKKTIVLPEAYERRTLDAADMILKEDIADVILVGNRDKVLEAGKGCDLSKAIIIDPENYERMDEVVAAFCDARKSKGLTPEEALQTAKADYTYFGVLLVKIGVADGMVSGAVHSTADTLRPALQILKTAPGTELVSSFFVMCCKDDTYGNDGVLLFADCALNQNPNPEELAAIATASAASFEAFVGGDARVAMLSHSTKGSAKHAEIKLDGELQLDAALVKEVGELKAPTSDVAGKANVLIFPDIDAGNIGYKLVQRFAGAKAFGPVLQGLAAPVNDLSRGCNAEDIVACVALTAFQATIM